MQMPIMFRVCSKGQHKPGGNHWQCLKGPFLSSFSPNTHVFQEKWAWFQLTCRLIFLAHNSKVAVLAAARRH